MPQGIVPFSCRPNRGVWAAGKGNNAFSFAPTPKVGLPANEPTHMGIRIYTRWKSQTQEEEAAQFTGYSLKEGRVGCLHESYHESPYATMRLLREAFDADRQGVAISAVTLRERLPSVLEIVERWLTDPVDDEPEDKVRAFQKSLADFVDLCERRERETGEPVTIIADF